MADVDEGVMLAINSDRSKGVRGKSMGVGGLLEL